MVTRTNNEFREIRADFRAAGLGPQKMGPLDRLAARVKEAYASFKAFSFLEFFKAKLTSQKPSPASSQDLMFRDNLPAEPAPSDDELIKRAQRKVRSLQNRAINLAKDFENNLSNIQDEKNNLQRLLFKQREIAPRNKIEGDREKELKVLAEAAEASKALALANSKARVEGTELSARGDVLTEENETFAALQKEIVQQELEIAKRNLIAATNRVNQLGEKLLSLSPNAIPETVEPKKGFSPVFKAALAAAIVSTVAYGVVNKYSSEIEGKLSQILKSEQMSIVKTYAAQLQAKMSSGQEISMAAVNAFVAQLRLRAKQATALASVYRPAIEQFGLNKLAALKSIDLNTIKEFGSKVMTPVVALLKTKGQEGLVTVRYVGESLASAAKETGKSVVSGTQTNPRKATAAFAAIPLVGSAVIVGNLLRKKTVLDDPNAFMPTA